MAWGKNVFQPYVYTLKLLYIHWVFQELCRICLVPSSLSSGVNYLKTSQLGCGKANATQAVGWLQ